MKYTGGCHCGNVRFEVEASTPLVCHECNCSICSKSGYLHLIVPLSQWRLLRGEESLATYTFGSGIAKHQQQQAAVSQKRKYWEEACCASFFQY